MTRMVWRVVLASLLVHFARGLAVHGFAKPLRCRLRMTTESPPISSEGILTSGLLLDECSGMGNASGGMIKTMRWNARTGQFELMYQSSNDAKRIKKRAVASQMLWEMFMPTGELTPDYYAYTIWRLAQRFVAASSSVFGTQALVLALGFTSSSIGIAAATRWVLKDALGKFSRIFWASKHGRKFDFNAKKWRFRSSILFAAGNGFEILTYIFPSLFLVLAALANASKQMAMLTSSATRNAIYKSFSRKSDNIGDITAKGEAQIAVVDLLGMVVGILLARIVALDRVRMVVAFVFMSMLDIFCIHKEIRSVIFNSLNFERTGLVLQSIFDRISTAPATAKADSSSDKAATIITPSEVAEREELLMPYSVSERIFTTWSGVSSRVSPRHLQASFELFYPNQRFCIVLYRSRGGQLVPQVLLRKEATGADIFRALVVVHKALHDDEKTSVAVPASATATDEERQAKLDRLLRDASDYEQAHLNAILEEMKQAGWDVSKFSYGVVSDRVLW